MAWESQPKSSKVFRRGVGLNLAYADQPTPRTSEQVPQSVTSGSYRHRRKLMHSATERGYDDVLFIDKRGLIGRTIHADIIFQFADNLHTPVADVFPNNGPRQAFIDLAHEQGIKVYERHILPRDIGYVKEAFLVDFRRGITPLRSIGGVRCEVSVLRSRIEY